MNHTWFSMFETVHFWHSETCPKTILRCINQGQILLMRGPRLIHVWAGTPDRRCKLGALPLPLLTGGTTGEQVPLHNSIVGNFRDAWEPSNDRGIAPCFLKATTGAKVPFHNRITGNHGRPQGGKTGICLPLEIRTKKQKFLGNVKSGF